MNQDRQTFPMSSFFPGNGASSTNGQGTGAESEGQLPGNVVLNLHHCNVLYSNNQFQHPGSYDVRFSVAGVDVGHNTNGYRAFGQQGHGLFGQQLPAIGHQPSAVGPRPSTSAFGQRPPGIPGLGQMETPYGPLPMPFLEHERPKKVIITKAMGPHGLSRNPKRYKKPATPVGPEPNPLTMKLDTPPDNINDLLELSQDE